MHSTDDHRLELPSETRALRGLYDPLGLDGAHDYDRLWREDLCDFEAVAVASAAAAVLAETRAGVGR